MKSKAKKQNKLVRFITAPFKAVNKYYVKAMFDCATNMNKCSVADFGMTPTVPLLPRNLSVNSSSNERNREEELRKLIRVLSTKLAAVSASQLELQKRTVIGVSGWVDRSYSVGVGIMGRIDEDKPCDFKAGDVNVGVFPRSTSRYALTRRN